MGKPTKLPKKERAAMAAEYVAFRYGKMRPIFTPRTWAGKPEQRSQANG